MGGPVDYRARYYNPTTGRFLGEDPLRPLLGLDPYGYASDNPISFADPSGLRATQIGLGITIVLGFGISYTGGLGFAADDLGNVGFYQYQGGGVSADVNGLSDGFEIDGGFEMAWTNSQNVQDLGGQATSYSAGGETGSADL
jgi:uncharacterized protein RhaS with RHS repeats